MYLRGQKMYLVNNVLENQIRAVPLLHLLLIFTSCTHGDWSGNSSKTHVFKASKINRSAILPESVNVRLKVIYS